MKTKVYFLQFDNDKKVICCGKQNVLDCIYKYNNNIINEYQFDSILYKRLKNKPSYIKNLGVCNLKDLMDLSIVYKKDYCKDYKQRLLNKLYNEEFEKINVDSLELNKFKMVYS